MHFNCVQLSVPPLQFVFSVVFREIIPSFLCCCFFFVNIQVSHLFTRCVLDIGLFVAFTTFLLLPLWILYVWITGLDPELHATNPAETWGQEAHDALIANENYSKNREGKRKCSSSHCSVSVFVNFHGVRNIIRNISRKSPAGPLWAVCSSDKLCSSGSCRVLRSILAVASMCVKSSWVTAQGFNQQSGCKSPPNFYLPATQTRGFNAA